MQIEALRSITRIFTATHHVRPALGRLVAAGGGFSVGGRARGECGPFHQSEMSLWSRDPLSTNHSSPAGQQQTAAAHVSALAARVSEHAVAVQLRRRARHAVICRQQPVTVPGEPSKYFSIQCLSIFPICTSVSILTLKSLPDCPCSRRAMPGTGVWRAPGCRPRRCRHTASCPDPPPAGCLHSAHGLYLVTA